MCDYMCTDTATDPDMETIIFIGPCSNLCRTVQVNGWVRPTFVSLLVPFPAILLSCQRKNVCEPVIA